MPRLTSTAMLDWLAQTDLPVGLFFTGTFRTGPVYLWTGYGPITWNGHTWQGIGTLGTITPIKDGSNVEARGISVNLSGFDSSLLALVKDEFNLGGSMAIYVGGFNDGVLIVDPIVSFAGRLDQPTISADGKVATISINCESRLLDMNVAVDRRYTADDQQRDWPGDLGMNFVNSIQEFNLWWGTTPVSSGNI